MKLLVLSFYYQPDLCAGSFRCTALIEHLSRFDDLEIDVITTLPNRYSSFSSDAKEVEILGNVTIHRIGLPNHNSGMVDQARAFYCYYSTAQKLTSKQNYDAVFATSSRLFTAFLGARIAGQKRVPLYLDIRDIFVDTIKDVLPSKLALAAKPVFSAIEQFTFKRAKRINLVSKGFEQYFSERYWSADYRWFTNGIDEVFLQERFTLAERSSNKNGALTVLYAGNIGEGQGLHTIIPELAETLGDGVKLKIIGDGGRKSVLVDRVSLTKVKNVELVSPVNRKKLIDEYHSADVLFLHLNDYPAFKKVLPSKIFEYAATGKPILAGVSGYAADFLNGEVPNAAVFHPGDHAQAVKALASLDLESTPRSEFIKKYSRSKIMHDMASDIVDLVREAKEE